MSTRIRWSCRRLPCVVALPCLPCLPASRPRRILSSFFGDDGGLRGDLPHGAVLGMCRTSARKHARRTARFVERGMRQRDDARHAACRSAKSPSRKAGRRVIRWTTAWRCPSSTTETTAESSAACSVPGETFPRRARAGVGSATGKSASHADSAP